MNNKTLGLVFSALLLIYLLFRLFGSNKERSFDSNIIELDTAKVTSVLIEPKNEMPFTLNRTGSEWQIQQDGKTYKATNSSVQSLLNNLQNISAQRVVSRNKEKWADYEVGEDGTRVTASAGNKTMCDVRVGRFSFNQVNRSSISYVRPEGDEAVYAVDGFLSMSLGQGANNYRNKRLLQLNSNDLRQIKASGTSGDVTLTKSVSGWTDGNVQIDSTDMANYLNGIQSVSGIDFADEGVINNAPIASLEMSGNNLAEPIVLRCYDSGDSTKMFALYSNQNEEGVFLSDSSSIYDRTFGKFYNLLPSE